jgi:hypothetical protein
MAATTWIDDQPNILANQPNDQYLNLRNYQYVGDDWRVMVRHDAICDTWYAYGDKLNGKGSLYWPQSWSTREAAKDFINANYGK